MPVTFDGSSSTSPSGDPLTYSWTFGDGGTATGPTPTHIYRAPGSDQVVLTVSDGFGGVSTATATISVIDVVPAFTPNSFTAPETYTAPAGGDDFGESVAAIYGNVAVGAPAGNGTSVLNTGVVDLYDGVPTDDGVSTTYAYGALVHVFEDPDPVPGDEFGASLAVIGNDLVIGAPGASGGTGAVYVFDANPDDATFGDLLATIAMPGADAGPGAEFGAAVGATATNILVGAPGAADGQGAAFEFEGDSTGPDFGDLLLSIALPGAASTPPAGFGAAVAGLGSNIVVGAPESSTAQAGSLGNVYVIDGTTGSLQTTIANPEGGSGFGSAVASVGSNILIGSPQANSGAGAAFLDNTTSGVLTPLVQPDGGGGHFGAAVAGSQNTALVGAPGADLGTSGAGAVYLFDADPESPTFGNAIAAEQEPLPGTGDLFGAAVGFDNAALIVGAAGAPGSGTSGAGTVNLYQAGNYLPGNLVSVSSATTYVTSGAYDSVILSGTFSETDPSAQVTVSIDWGDGSTTTMPLPEGAYAFSAPHAYVLSGTINPPSRYAIGVTLTDVSGNSSFTQTSVAIADPAPVFAAPGLVLSSYSIDTYDTITAGGTIESPGGGHTNTVSINWGDGSAATTIVLPPGDDTFTKSHQYLSNPPGVISSVYAIQAVVTNEEGKTGTAAASLAVIDAGPQLTAAGLSATPATINQGGTTTLGGEFTDPAPLGDITATIDWGDATAPTVLYGLFNQIISTGTPGLYGISSAHQYMTSGNYDITVSLSDGTVTTTGSTTIAVIHVAPTIRIESAGSESGDTVSLMGVVSQPGASETETVSWVVTDNGTVIATGTGADFRSPTPIRRMW